MASRLRGKWWYLVSLCGARATDLTVVYDGKNIFVSIDGLKVAKRENGQWTSLIRGYEVEDIGDEIHLHVAVMH